MFIRPYTISQTAVVLLGSFLLIYLQIARQQQANSEDRATAWSIQALIWGVINVVINLIAGLSESAVVDAISYVRSFLAILLLSSSFR